MAKMAESSIFVAISEIVKCKIVFVVVVDNM
jgi:hypothetical protein